VVHAAPLPSGEIRGRAAFLTGVASGTGAWPPGRVIVTHLLSDGNEVAVYGFFQEGGSPLSPSGDGGGPGPRVSVAAVNRMEGGRIAETWAVWDSRALDELRTRSTAVSQDPGGND
jgi:predicted ester cyclase